MARTVAALRQIRSEADFHEDARRKLEYDLYYVRLYSLLTDLLIVLRTAAAGLRGAR